MAAVAAVGVAVGRPASTLRSAGAGGRRHGAGRPAADHVAGVPAVGGGRGRHRRGRRAPIERRLPGPPLAGGPAGGDPGRPGGRVPAARRHVRRRAPGVAAGQPAGGAGRRADHGVGPHGGLGRRAWWAGRWRVSSTCRPARAARLARRRGGRCGALAPGRPPARPPRRSWPSPGCWLLPSATRRSAPTRGRCSGSRTAGRPRRPPGPLRRPAGGSGGAAAGALAVAAWPRPPSSRRDPAPVGAGAPLGLGAEAWRAGGRRRPSRSTGGRGPRRCSPALRRRAVRPARRRRGADAGARPRSRWRRCSGTMAAERRARPRVRSGARPRRRAGAAAPGRRPWRRRRRRGRRSAARATEVADRLDVTSRWIRSPVGAGRPGPAPPGHVSSALVPLSLPPVAVAVGDVGAARAEPPVESDDRVLVAGVVPPPRFGRESEVVATARGRAGRGRRPRRRVARTSARRPGRPRHRRAGGRASVTSLDGAAAAGRAGAALVLVPAGALVAAVAHADARRTPPCAAGRGRRPGPAVAAGLAGGRTAGVAAGVRLHPAASQARRRSRPRPWR